QLMIRLVSYISPGSALELEGVGIPTSNVQVHINGVVAPILSLSATTILLQVPWEVPAQVSNSFEVTAPTNSPFDTTFSFRAFSLSWSPRFSAPIHEDWNAEVSSDNPARPGEVIYFYATGLGPVDPQVPTGVPAPDDPP